MRRVLLGGLTLVCLTIVAWTAQQGITTNKPAPVGNSLPHAFGPIQPRVSPDGSQIAFSYQGAIWRITRQGGVMTRLTDKAGFDIEPAWSPDGKLLAYVNAPRMSGGPVHVIHADTGQPVELPTAVQVVDTVSYSKLEFHPDGRLLGNLRIDGKDLGLALIDLKSGATQPIVKVGRSARYALSHDGKWIAYTATMDVDGQQWGNDGPQGDIWKISTTGSEPQKLTRFPSKLHDVCWSADDAALFVVSEFGGAHYDIWRVPVNDPERGARRITFGHADEDRPSVSSDGALLVYTDNRTGATALVTHFMPSGLETTVQVSRLDFRKPTGTLRLKITDKETGEAVTARVSLQNTDGKYYAPPGALHRVLDDYGHFYCKGDSGSFALPEGNYRMRIFRGPEYRVSHSEFNVGARSSAEISATVERWTNAPANGWYSGENHIHANYGYGNWYNGPETMLEQCAGEDLRVCHFMVANSDTDGVFDREYFRGRPDPLSTRETVLYWNQEFRSTLWGHMTLVNLNQLVEPIFTGFKDTTNPWDIPTNSDIADRAHLQHAIVNYTHGAQNAEDPYLGAYTGKSIPMDVALGKIDTLDLNASYAGTVPLWYRLLNCGFKLPASAGTDCFLNRIRSRLPGADRVYVKIDGEFDHQKWIDGLRTGRSFVTSGPMLELAVDDRAIGDTIRLPAPRDVRVVAKALSQFPLNRVEVVFNGKPIATGTLSADKLQCDLDQSVKIPRSGWLSLRAAGNTHPDHSGGPLEAHTSPVYVLIGDQPIASREDAEYFLAWLERLSLAVRLRDRIPSPELKRHVENQLEAARAVYARIAQSAK
jgi:TolB protein